MREPRSKLWQSLTTPPPSTRIVGKAADSCDECGIFPLIDWNSEFKSACVWHDSMYLMKEQGSLPPDYSRARVDVMFFRQCLAIAEKWFEETADARLYRKAAQYYVVVSLASWVVW